MAQQQSSTPANVVNPLGVTAFDNKVALLYQSKRRGHNKLSLALASNGTDFRENSDAPVIMTGANTSEDINSLSDMHFGVVLGEEFLTYSRAGRLHLASRSQLDDFDISLWEHRVSRLPNAKAGVIVSEFKSNGRYVLYYSNTSINVGLSTDLKSWHSPHQSILPARPHNFDRANLRIISAQLISQGILLIYESVTYKKSQQVLSIGAALAARNNPAKIIWRSEAPLWSVQGSRALAEHAIGAVVYKQDVLVYLTNARGNLSVLSLPQPFAVDIIKPRPSLQLDKHHANPLIAPEGGGDWEAVGTFNPAVLHDDDGTIHILYRALDYSGMSYVGYASSLDGKNIDYRHGQPAYWPRKEFEGAGVAKFTSWSEDFGSGGGWGGCEDPKVTRIDNTVYLTYVAHNGYGPPRVAMSSIDIEDFRAHNWDKWAEPRLISEPGIVNKSGIIMPEKVGGKYVIFHRVFPNILVHYTDSLEALGKTEWLTAHDSIPPRANGWDSRKLSIGSTPIRIKDGWLVIYHAVDDRDDSKYKIGAMILDHDDPAKVLYRTKTPVLEPSESYENEWKFGIAYPSGAAIKDGTLLVYYGGGDRHVCVATANLEEFVRELKRDQEVHLHPAEINVD